MVDNNSKEAKHQRWGWWALSKHRSIHTPRSAYARVATEFGVTEEMIRRICGPVGNTNITFEERLALLRAKMDAAGLAPMRVNVIDTLKNEEPEEPRELRSCVLCEEFLDGDDPGQSVVNAEDYLERGCICSRCRGLSERI